jgi:hydrogenase/urease accessory protein HupE
MMRLLILAVLVLASLASPAHESRPAYLEIIEGDAGTYALTWKIPRRGDLVLPLRPVLPADCRDLVPEARLATPGGLVVRRSLDCGSAGLSGQEILIDGLSGSITDALVRVTLLSGEVQTVILKPDAPGFIVAEPQSAGDVFLAYLVLGVEHILFGIDHLLFVLGLLLLVNGVGLLVKTVTAFTVAHSVTLGGAALGLVNVPQAPVEAAIALSILFLATELVKKHQGQVGLAESRPWLVALSFGLLHGFGFAGALAEIGLPETAIPLALLSFNLGVEIGQLLFVFAAVLVIALLTKLPRRRPAWVELAPAYGIGSVAAFWTIQRVAGF